jgi:hypothetical protein
MKCPSILIVALLIIRSLIGLAQPVRQATIDDQPPVVPGPFWPHPGSEAPRAIPVSAATGMERSGCVAL